VRPFGQYLWMGVTMGIRIPVYLRNLIGPGATRAFAAIVAAGTCIYSQVLLPEARKGDWHDAGCLRHIDIDDNTARINDMRDYGAAAGAGLDNANKNQGAIMKAAADSAANGFTVIFLPEGTYSITSPVSIKGRSRLILRGEGPGRTKLMFNFGGIEDLYCLAFEACSTIGIEDLYVERQDSCSFFNSIDFKRCTSCWVSGVESYRTSAIHIRFYSSERMELRGSYLHHAWNYGVGGHGYGLEMYGDTKGCLVENNIFHHIRHSVILSDGASSNVVGYNYSTDPYTTETYFGISDWPSDMCLHGHPSSDAPGPRANLFEGNICAYMSADDAWAENGPYNTYFRNRATYYGLTVAQPSDSQNIIANEVDDADGQMADVLWNALTIRSAGNFVAGNTNLDSDPPEYPAAGEQSGDLSLYLNPDSLPSFLDGIGYLPPIGVVDDTHRGGGTNPAKARWDAGGVLTVPQSASTSTRRGPMIRHEPGVPANMWARCLHIRGGRQAMLPQQNGPYSVYDIRGRCMAASGPGGAPPASAPSGVYVVSWMRSQRSSDRPNPLVIQILVRLARLFRPGMRTRVSVTVIRSPLPEPLAKPAARLFLFFLPGFSCADASVVKSVFGAGIVGKSEHHDAEVHEDG